MLLMLKLAQTMKCRVCKQDEGSESKGVRQLADLVGTVAYMTCPCCGQIVHKHQDRNYRRRFRRFIKRKRRESN